ncbi:protein max isoform X2 [Pogoniulus pusillus]|uniref:protein max isoform X2 n=1 Tax=Pogoniulus pusillus TaxID=488313 RepID=UPI0030B92EF6
MSDNDDIEVESDADKRAHHNALERKRRDHIKDSFHSLRDSVPSLQGEKGLLSSIPGGRMCSASPSPLAAGPVAVVSLGKVERADSTSSSWIFRAWNSGAWASRAQILDKATEYIQYMRRKNHTHQQDIDDLKRQNALLEQQVRALEKARSSAQLQANYPSTESGSLYTNAKGSTISAFDGGSDSSSDSEPEEPQNRKKLRMEAS